MSKHPAQNLYHLAEKVEHNYHSVDVQTPSQSFCSPIDQLYIITTKKGRDFSILCIEIMRDQREGGRRAQVVADL